MKLRYFTDVEHACQHCGKVGITQRLGEKLDQLRAALGRPLTLTSGYRCDEHPIEKRKAKAGTHAQGTAVDIKYSTVRELLSIIKEARRLGFKGLGIHHKFVHIDLRPNFMWWNY